MVTEEAPNKLAESFRLFLQGMGYGKSPCRKPLFQIDGLLQTRHNTSANVMWSLLPGVPFTNMD